MEHGSILVASVTDRLMEHGTVRVPSPLVRVQRLERGRVRVIYGVHAIDRWDVPELTTEGGELVHRAFKRDTLNLCRSVLEGRLVIAEDDEIVGLRLSEDLRRVFLGHLRMPEHLVGSE